MAGPLTSIFRTCRPSRPTAVRCSEPEMVTGCGVTLTVADLGEEQFTAVGMMVALPICVRSVSGPVSAVRTPLRPTFKLVVMVRSICDVLMVDRADGSLGMPPHRYSFPCVTLAETDTNPTPGMLTFTLGTLTAFVPLTR